MCLESVRAAGRDVLKNDESRRLEDVIHEVQPVMNRHFARK